MKRARWAIVVTSVLCAADEFPEIEARARWISEKIDAGDWESLGF